jgi:ParB-like chromosome segregation protein Spo0J
MAAPPRDKGRSAVATKSRALERLVVEYVNVDAIRPNDYNANRQDEREFELLQRSMREDGFTQPVVVHKPTMEIVDGEHRWRAAQAIGWTEIPVVFVDMDDVQRRISTLRHNRARGNEDVDLASDVLRDLQALGALAWAQDSLMLDDNTINALINDTPAPELLGGAEWSNAWVPTNEERRPELNEEFAANSSSQGLVMSRTPAAAAAQADSVRRMDQAGSEVERQDIVRQTRVYPIHLTFRAEEAELVRAELGAKPAERLLALCQAELTAAASYTPLDSD